MRIVSTAALAILSGGKYVKGDLLDILLKSGETHYFTSLDVPVSAAIATGPSTFGSTNNYLTGLTISRGQFVQSVGLDVQKLTLTIAPQPDNPAGVVTFGGYNLQQAIGQGILDGATIAWHGLYMNMPTLAAMQPDTSPGGINFFTGQVGDCDPVGRFSAQIKVACGLQYLQTQMPRNLFQAGCVHTVYDTGCGLQTADNTYAGTVGSVTSGSAFATNLTQADGFFNLGFITFTTGVNSGLQQTVSSHVNASGALLLSFPFANPPAPGDTFNIVKGCDRQKSTCASGNFKIGSSSVSNLPHHKGLPFVPVTETLYDGGSVNVNQAPVITPAQPVTSGTSGKILPGISSGLPSTGSSGTVTSVISTSAFSVSVSKPNGFFDGGLITFGSGILSGGNAGKSQYIATSLATGALTLNGPMPAGVVIGSTVTLTPAP